MSTKYWKDPGALDFVRVKRPVEFAGLSPERVKAKLEALAEAGKPRPLPFLWSSNNSLTVDSEFWDLVNDPEADSDLARWAKALYDEAVTCAYIDGTGEPGFINVDRLTDDETGLDAEAYVEGAYFGSSTYAVAPGTRDLLRAIYDAFTDMPYHYITNPCVTGDAWIETQEGPRRVNKLLGKPFTALVNGKPYAARQGFIFSGVQPVYLVTTSRGYSVRVTSDLKVLIESSRRRKLYGGYNLDCAWVNVSDLKAGDRIVLDLARYLCTVEDNHHFKKGWLLGEMVGDGGYNPDSYSGYVRFWGSHAEEMAHRSAEAIKEHFSPRSDFKGPVWNAKNRTFTVTSSELTFLAQHLIEPRTKRGTDLLEMMPPDFLRGFLRGLFDADGSPQGSTSKGVSVRLSQSDESKLKMVQRILLRFGLVSTIFRNRRSDSLKLLPNGKGGYQKYYTKPSHELVISNASVSRFRDVIGFHQPDKAERLDYLLTGRKRALNLDQFTAKVESILPVGSEETFCCSVEIASKFVANGLIVCGGNLLRAQKEHG